MGAFSGSEPYFLTQDVVDPQKKAVSTPLSSFLASQVGKGVGEFPGQTAAPFSAEGDERINEFLALSPKQFFQENVIDPTFKKFSEDVLPVVEEGFAGSLRGSGRFGSVQQAGADVAEGLVETGAQFIPQMYQAQADVATSRKMTAEAVELQDFQQWLQGLPQYNPAMQQALTYLSKSTGTGTTTLSALIGGKSGWAADLVGDAIGAAATVATVKIMLACFDEDTPVQLDDGVKRIADIKLGDVVQGKDGSDTVTMVQAEAKPSTLIVNDVKTTYEHPFVMVSGELRCAGNLIVGDVLYGDIKVVSLKHNSTSKSVRYNIATEKHFYKLGCGIVVHDGREVL